MKIQELLENKDTNLQEAKKAASQTATAPKPRNFVAKHAKRSGAGSHSPTKYTRKEKHKKKP